MTAKTMAKVLAEHIPERLEGYIGVRCGCGTWFLADAVLTSHQQDMLTAAGFGLVADAKAEALEEAADGFARAGNNVRNSTYVESGIYHDLVQQVRGLESAAETLRAQAAKIRAAS